MCTVAMQAVPILIREMMNSPTKTISIDRFYDLTRATIGFEKYNEAILILASRFVKVLAPSYGAIGFRSPATQSYLENHSGWWQ
jgi:hypothetical protein